MRLIVRVLDAERHVLGWGEMVGRLPGNGTIEGDLLPIAIMHDGRPRWVSVHWCDAHIEVRLPFPGSDAPLMAGSVVALDWRRRPVIVLGQPPTDLPPVTVLTPVWLAPPSGTFSGAAGVVALTASLPVRS